MRWPNPPKAAAYVIFRRGGRVLVVDDQEDQRTPLAGALRQGGFTVVEAGRGREAIDMLLNDREPDILLLDLHLPDLSGWEVLSVMRRYLRLRRIPVIVVTGHAAALQASGPNVVARFEKPVDVDELLDTVRRHLRGAPKAPTDEPPPEGD